MFLLKTQYIIGRMYGVFSSRSHSGNFYDFEEFHKGHVSMHTTKEWKKMFAAAGYQPVAEEYRRAWIVKDINPPFAKKLSRMCPDLFAHQFYFALEKTMQN